MYDESHPSSRPLPGVLISLQSRRQDRVRCIRVLVPFPGFLYLYTSLSLPMTQRSLCSRPLPGVLISLRKDSNQRKKRHWVLVPFPGFLYLYTVLLQIRNNLKVLVPFPGFLYLYRRAEVVAEKTGYVLVPFPGFLYLYRKWGFRYIRLFRFSSPSRGSYISTPTPTPQLRKKVLVLVPFPGFLYLYVERSVFNIALLVLVPFPGFLYLYTR